MKSIGIIASWSIHKNGNDLFVPSTHYVYIKYLVTQYDKVYLISPLSENGNTDNNTLLKFDNLCLVPLPENKGYLAAQKNFFKYYQAVKYIIPYVDLIYCRVPDPFSWIAKLLFKKKCIMHFVGDTINATKYNEKWSCLKKTIMIAGYYPDYILTLFAASRSKVYCNGFHLVSKLNKYGVKATGVISSTISKNELIEPKENLPIHKDAVNIIYIGYLRYAKGINTIINLLLLLKQSNINFHFDIVGKGEMFDELHSFVEKEQLMDNVTMHGHIDNRQIMNNMLRNSDLFFFPSLSEGSPRVVIEAMAHGCPVISTPVGSLPTTFKDKESIRFFNYNNANEALALINEYISNHLPFIKQRNIAYNLVKDNYTIESFLSKIFNYET